jgi:hypothetical protein
MPTKKILGTGVLMRSFWKRDIYHIQYPEKWIEDAHGFKETLVLYETNIFLVKLINTSFAWN